MSRAGRAAAALAAALLPALASSGARPAYGGRIRVAVTAVPLAVDLDAPSGPAEAFLGRALAAPLLEVDASGKLVPGALAEVPAPDAGGLAWRLRLRPGLTTWTGAPIAAADLTARIGALLARGGSPGAWAALPIAGADAVLDGRASAPSGVQVLSDRELLVTLAFPLPELPWLLATPPLAIPDAGPFVAAPRRAPADPLLLRANAHHHRGRPFADAVELRAADPRSAARLLEAGALVLVLRR